MLQLLHARARASLTAAVHAHVRTIARELVDVQR
jgi:hypothetical protein